MSKTRTSGVIVTVEIPREVVASMEALARKTTKSRDRIILRAVETYMLYEGADIYEAITARERAAVGRVPDLTDIIAQLDEVVVRIEK
jgi:predicted transcriptional regulator